jgi:transmembrane sensor
MAVFRTHGRIRREAADWAARLGGGATEEDLAAFRRWQGADRRNAEAYDRIAAIWSAAGKLPVPAGAAARDGPPVQLRQRPLVFAMAASLVVGMALVAVLIGARWIQGSASEAALSFASGIGEIRQVDLPDGSHLVLDSGSRVEARFDASDRLLTLREGRARFIVAHEARPFIVRAAANEVVATGTVFDVSLIQNRLAVLLIEGTVEVRQASDRHVGSTQRLRAGQKLVITGQNGAVLQNATRGETLWPSQMIAFDDTPLGEAVATVNRYSPMQLRLGDDRIGGLRVSGAYRAGDVAGFARSLAAAFGLRLQTLPDGSLLLAEPEVAARPSAPTR